MTTEQQIWMQVGLDKACPSELTVVQKPKTKGKKWKPFKTHENYPFALEN